MTLTSIVMLSSQLPFTHRSKLSIPINQSGDGTILDMSDTYRETNKDITINMTLSNSVFIRLHLYYDTSNMQ